jgi:hypothetical protein
MESSVELRSQMENGRSERLMEVNLRHRVRGVSPAEGPGADENPAPSDVTGNFIVKASDWQWVMDIVEGIEGI